MSDKLLIDLWGASISADGVVAIVAAVIIVVAFVRWRLWQALIGSQVLMSGPPSRAARKRTSWYRCNVPKH